MAVSPNFDPDFLELMPFTVTVAPKSGQNQYNEETYGTAVEVTTTFEIWLDTVDTIAPDAQLTLTGAEWIDTTPEIFTVRRVSDENGNSHVQLSCGWTYHRQGS
jgi:hypothetical protein